MPASTDHQLLADFTAGNRDAMNAVVQRHLDLVYSAALRQVRDANLADDVTQAVFIILCSKAKSLRPGTILEGWLYNTTRYAARNALRMARRRQLHERCAAKEEPVSQINPPLWETMSPLLDQAISQLAAGDRDAVLLRYVRNQSYTEVALNMGLTEPAARKRVARAVEKLRAHFTRHGILLTGESLTGAITAHGILPSPAHLLPQVSAATAIPSAASLAGASIARSTLSALYAFKIKVAASILIVCILGSAGAVAVAHALAQAPPAPKTPEPQPVVDTSSADTWEQKFYRIYGLSDGEMARHVPTPFGPERLEFYRHQNPAEAQAMPQGPVFQILHWDGKLHIYHMAFGGRRTVRNTLTEVGGLARYELEGDTALLDRPFLPGDWVIREGSTHEQLVPAIEEIINRHLTRKIHLTKQHVERDVFVARGQLALPPDPQTNLRSLDVYVDKKDPKQRTFPLPAQMSDIFRQTAARTGYQVIDETDDRNNPAPDRDIHVSYHPSSWIDSADKNHLSKTQTMLAHLAADTGLTITLEKRQVDVWITTPTP